MFKQCRIVCVTISASATQCVQTYTKIFLLPLQVNQQCIPVHSMYTCNMERVLAGLWHPSAEEEAQQRIVALWEKKRLKQTQFKPPSSSPFTVR